MSNIRYVRYLCVLIFTNCATLYVYVLEFQMKKNKYICEFTAECLTSSTGTRDNNSVQFIPHVKKRWRRGASPQDVLADEAAVVAVGAGDEQQHLAGVLHAAQPRLDVVGAGLQVAARVPLHVGEVGAGVL